MSPFKLTWNRGRDDELRKLESLARDGIRVANAQLLAFAHLANSFVSPDKALLSEERGLTVEVMRDLSQTTRDHFVKIVEQSVVARRLDATQALNFADRSPLLSAPLGSDSVRRSLAVRSREERRATLEEGGCLFQQGDLHVTVLGRNKSREKGRTRQRAWFLPGRCCGCYGGSPECPAVTAALLTARRLPR